MEEDTNQISIDFTHDNDDIVESSPILNRTFTNDTEDASHSSESLHIPVKINIQPNDNHNLQPNIGDVEEEIGLSLYTDNHFTSITNKDLERVRNLYTTPLILPDETHIVYKSSSNSPVLSILDSNRGSRSNSDEEPEAYEPHNLPANNDIPIRARHRNRYNKLAYRDVERSISKYYKQNQNNSLCSNEIDILTTYVKGQKHLYNQSKLITQQKLYCLVFPAIIISAVITIISPFVECQSWNVGIISGLNAIVTLFISLLNVLKYESSVEMFTLLSSLFDNIETSLELTSSKLTMLQQTSDTSSTIIAKFNEVETKISDYKLTNPVIVPEEIKHLFPIISHINIFSFIKKTELHRKSLIEKLRDIKNEIYFILYKWDKMEKIEIQTKQLQSSSLVPTSSLDKIQHQREHERLISLYALKEITKNEIIEFQQTYSVMDTIFNREISGAERHRNKFWGYLLCYYVKPPVISYDYLDGITPILSSYFSNNIINEYTVRTKSS